MTLDNIPHFLKAKTPDGLRRLMLQNNLKRKLIFDYKIVHDGKNWFAWYRFDAVETMAEELKEIESRGKNGN